MHVASGRSVCVFCGSRSGGDPRYAQAATELGGALAGAGIRLVYGAGDVGLMARSPARRSPRGARRSAWCRSTW